MNRHCVTNPSQPAQSEQAHGGTGRLAACKFLFATIAAVWLWGTQAIAADGLTTLASSFRPKETMDRLEAGIKAKGMTVFARIDHATGAAEAGLPLRPTELLIFGNAKAGTPLMQANLGDRHRSAVESAGVRRRGRQGLAVL